MQYQSKSINIVNANIYNIFITLHDSWQLSGYQLALCHFDFQINQKSDIRMVTVI